MKDRVKAILLTACGFIITASAILIIALLVVQEPSRSSAFWRRLAWTEFLCLLVWCYWAVSIWVSMDKSGERYLSGGLVPAMGMLVNLYALLSLGLMATAAMFPELRVLRQYHLVFQIALAAAVLILVVFLYFSQLSANQGMATLPNNLSPEYFVRELKEQEARLRSVDADKNQFTELRMELQSLRERLDHSLPKRGDIGAHAAYQALSRDVAVLIDRLRILTCAEPANPDIIDDIVGLRNRLENLAASLRR